MSKGRLTREEIEAAHDALCAAVALNLDMSKHWCEQKWEQAHMLRDLALQSLSQEAVREEGDLRWALAALDLVANGLQNRRGLEPNDVEMRNLKAAKVSIEHALKREPNAAGQVQAAPKSDQAANSPASEPAPAAPVDEMVRRLRSYANESGGGQVEQDLLEAAALLELLGQQAE